LGGGSFRIAARFSMRVLANICRQDAASAWIFGSAKLVIICFVFNNTRLHPQTVRISDCNATFQSVFANRPDQEVATHLTNHPVDNLLISFSCWRPATAGKQATARLPAWSFWLQ
jgi:hypothetical protein